MTEADRIAASVTSHAVIAWWVKHWNATNARGEFECLELLARKFEEHKLLYVMEIYTDGVSGWATCAWTPLGEAVARKVCS